MKKLIVILTAIAFVTSCVVIDPQLTGKRVIVAPDEYSESPYYGPYAYAGPMISFGMGLWLSPFYWGSWWGPWGYPGWSSWWGYPGWGYYPGYGYPGWGYYPGYGYPGYGYPYYRGNKIYRGQLKKGSATRSGTRGSVKRGSTSRGYSGSSKVSKGSSSGVRGGSSGRTSSGGSGTRVKKK